MAPRTPKKPVPQESEAPTDIQKLVLDPERVAQLIGPLNQFLSKPENENAIRLATIATTPRKSTDRSYQKQEDEFRKLFPDADIFADKIRRWVLDTYKGDDFKSYLAILVVHRLQQHPHLYQEQILSGSPRISLILQKIENYVVHQDAKFLIDEEKGDKGLTPVEALALAVEASTDTNTLLQVLFDRPKDTVRGDVSYYAVYRWSTKATLVVKTYLAVLTPNARKTERGAAKTFTFTHVYPDYSTRKRIARGGVMTSSQHISFLGTSGRNTTAGWLSQGVKVISVPPTPSSRHGFLLLPGVFFSHNLRGQPVVGRCALLHLGCRSQQGEVKDSHVRIGEFPRSKLSDDLRYMVEHFELEERHGLTPADIEDEILNRMNNVPSVDRPTVGKDGLLRSLCFEDDQEPGD